MITNRINWNQSNGTYSIGAQLCSNDNWMGTSFRGLNSISLIGQTQSNTNQTKLNENKIQTYAMLVKFNFVQSNTIKY